MIYIDDREPDKILKYFQENDVEAQVKRLDVGDIICDDKKICIERKSIEDFYGSLLNQRIFQQCIQMNENYEENFVLISGNFTHLLSTPVGAYASPHVFLGAIASLNQKYGVSVITVENDKQLVYLASKLIEKSGEVAEKKVVKRLSFTQESLCVSALTACRGVSDEKAKKVLEKFKTIGAICQASIDDLTQVDGIGKKNAANIKEIFV